jgi:hypothetical protein
MQRLTGFAVQRLSTTHVWYVQYGDLVGNIDAETMWTSIENTIKTQDPGARLLEIRQYPYQIACYVEHSPQVAKLSLAAIIFLVAIALAALFAAAGILISAMTNWSMETRTYYDKDPATGDPVAIVGWSAYKAWLIVHYPEQAQYLDKVGATNWFEQIGSWIPIVLILIGAAIVVPLVVKILPGGKS